MYVEHNMRAQSVVNPGMNKTTDPTKLTKLHELDSLLPREIRGQSHTLPRIISAVRRGELGLTKPARPRGSFLLLGPTGELYERRREQMIEKISRLSDLE